MIRLLRVRPADLLPGDWIWDMSLERHPAGFKTGKALLDMCCVSEVLRSWSGGCEVTIVPSSDRSIGGVATIRGHHDTCTVRVMRLEESTPAERCPVCGEDRFPANAMERIRALLRELNCTGEAMNPGGREFWFADGSRLQVHDMCDNCTIQSLAAYSAARPEDSHA